MHSKTTQRNKQIAMGRKKFNMDPKKVSRHPRFLTYKKLRFTDLTGSLILDRGGHLPS